MGSRLAVDLVAAVVGVLGLGTLGLLVVAVRRFLLERGPGTVECGLRVLEPGTAGHPAEPGRAGLPWRLGLARYRADELHWYRIFDISPRPRVVLCRRGLVVSSRRTPSARETAALGVGAVIVECRVPGTAAPVELAMSDAALTGFLAWLEASPPGFHLGQIA